MNAKKEDSKLQAGWERTLLLLPPDGQNASLPIWEKHLAPDLDLYLMDTSPLTKAALFDWGLGQVSPYRREKTAAIPHQAGRNVSLGVGLLLAHGLHALGHTEKTMAYQLGDRGKPRLVGYPDLHFSLSHSGTMAMACLSGQKVGCDVEKLGSPRLGLARHFFHPLEVDWLENLPAADQAEGFFRLWTSKESFLKMTGEGLALPLRDFLVLPLDQGFRFRLEENLLREKRLPRDYRPSFGQLPFPGYMTAWCRAVSNDV